MGHGLYQFSPELYYSIFREGERISDKEDGHSHSGYSR